MAYTERKRWLFFGLPWTFTKYTIGNEVLTVDTGLLKTEENDCYMYKIQDVKMETSLIEKMFGLGTIICFTGDVSTPKIELIHIKHAKEVKNFILENSEIERRKRRTLNTQNISAIDEDDMDDSI